MAFQSGTATDYRDLLDLVDKFVTNRHVSEVAINAAGTGYVVGDILTVAGGTAEGSMTAQIEVLTVGGSGDITAVRVYQSGAYSGDPTTTANAVTGGTGSSATMDLTMADTGWTNRIKNIAAATGPIEVASGNISDDGSGYAVDDIVTLNDTFSGTSKAQFKVLTVGGSGQVLAIEVYDPGDYDVYGSGSQPTTGGSGTGLLITPTFIPTRDEYMWEGSGTGGNAVFVGIRTGYAYNEDQVSWELAGYTGYGSGSDWEGQPGLSPGRCELGTSKYGSVVLLSEASMSFWFYASVRRIIVVANVSGNYQSCYLGLLDPFGTDIEIPYPLFVCGSTDRFDRDIGTAPIDVRSIADPTCYSETSVGPGQFRDGDASWNKVWNGNYYRGYIQNSGAISGYFVYPCSEPSTSGMQDENLFTTFVSPCWEDVIQDNRYSAQDVRFKPSPDSGGDIYWPIPCVIMRSEGVGTFKVIGEINGVFWLSAEDGIAVEDRLITAGGRYFRVFQMGANSVPYAHFCVEEN